MIYLTFKQVSVFISKCTQKQKLIVSSHHNKPLLFTMNLSHQKSK